MRRVVSRKLHKDSKIFYNPETDVLFSHETKFPFRLFCGETRKNASSELALKIPLPPFSKLEPKFANYVDKRGKFFPSKQSNV